MLGFLVNQLINSEAVAPPPEPMCPRCGMEPRGYRPKNGHIMPYGNECAKKIARLGNLKKKNPEQYWVERLKWENELKFKKEQQHDTA